MSQKSQQSENSKLAREKGYRESRRRAKAAAEHDVTNSLEGCKQADNLLLVHFLQEARESCRKEGAETFAKALHRAARELRTYPLRIYDSQRLKSVPGVGPSIVKVVEQHFWNDPDCKPYAPTGQEIEAEQTLLRDRCQLELAKKVALLTQEAVKRQRAEEKALKKRLDEVAAAQLAGGQSQARPANKKALEVMPATKAGLGLEEEDEGAKRGKKRQKQGTREYLPGVGTANYAFMIVLFQAHQNGEPYLTKHDLMNRAENLHITNKPIRGIPNQGSGQYAYDGWSSFTSLCNRQPPLCQAYSNPKKCRLTPEGEVLARRLYKDAVERQSIPPDPSIMAFLHRSDSGAQLLGCQEPAVRSSHPANEQGSTLARQAPARKAGALHQRSNGPLLQPEVAQTGKRALQQDGMGVTASQAGAMVIKDADFACLVEMGFTTEQATKGLAGGRSVAEAVQVIAIDSGSDSESAALMPATAFQKQAAGSAGHASARPLEATCGSAARAGFSAKSWAGHASTLGMPASAATSRPGPGPHLAAIGCTAADTAVPPHWRSQASVRQSAAGARQVANQAPEILSGLGVPGLGSVSGADSADKSRQGAGAAASGRAQCCSGPARTAAEAHTLVSRGVQGLWKLPLIGGLGAGQEERGIRLPPLPHGAAFADVYEVVLVLDTREQFGRHMAKAVGGGSTTSHVEAVQQITKLGIKVVSKSLEGGDAMWCAQPRAGGALFALDTVVERKRVDDLVSSIKDARYERQKYFLHRCGLRRLMYLLEGDIDLNHSSAQGPMNKACKTAMLQTEVVDGFQVLRTRDFQATFRLYQRITAALQEKYSALRADSPQVAEAGQPSVTLAQLDSHLLRAKRVTLRDLWGLMLTAIPGVGPEITEAILRVYATPISLWKAYDKAMHASLGTGSSAAAVANNLLVGLPINANRKITPMLSARVFTALYANGWQVA